MGTLDDAIREHLELKRRSGAKDDEVSRLENEAFGAARREPPAPGAEIAAPEGQPEAGELPPPPAAPDPTPAPTPAPDPVAATPPTPAPTESWLDDDDDVAEPEVPSATGQPTAEFSARQAGEAEDAAPSSDYVAPDEEGDDLLEETPDFLQETPEHDRLWFEQKPPRDFGFDK